MRFLRTALVAAAGLAFFLLAGLASRAGSEPSLAGIALYVAAGACFLLASRLYHLLP